MVYGSELTMGGARQAAARDENSLPTTTNTASTKAAGKGLRAADGNTVKSSTRAPTDAKRSILTDKSNRARQPSMLTTLKDKDKENTRDNTTQHTLKGKPSKEKLSVSKEKASVSKEKAVNNDVQVFFDDNSTRYPASSSGDMKPVPVLPIIVPDRIKAAIREQYLLHHANTKKRSFHASFQRREQLLATLKKHKSPASAADNDTAHDIDQGKENVDPNSTSAAPRPTQSSSSLSSAKSSKFSMLQRGNMPATVANDPETDEAARKFDEEQERRAREKLLEHARATEKKSEADDAPNDPALVAEYAEDIHRYLLSIERDTLANPNYIQQMQTDMTWRMRNVLIDWVVEAHYLFLLMPETLFLAVNIIDRVLSDRKVILGKLQLIGITALYVAAKFEESVAPPIQQFLYMTGDTIQEQDLLTAERYVLQCLDFKLSYPNPLHFYRHMTINMDCHPRLRLFAKYFMEISCMDHRFIAIPPSLIAAASFWLAMKLFVEAGPWTSDLVKSSGYTGHELKPTVELLLNYLSQPTNDEAFFNKWKSKRMYRVSLHVRDWVNRYYKS